MIERIAKQDQQRRTLRHYPNCLRSRTKFPPCTRNDQPGEYENERVVGAYHFARELIGKGSEAREFIDSIFCLHDHKGTLHVVSRRPLPDYCVAMVSVAWTEYAHECGMDVEFHTLNFNPNGLLTDPKAYSDLLGHVTGEL